MKLLGYIMLGMAIQFSLDTYVIHDLKVIFFMHQYHYAITTVLIALAILFIFVGFKKHNKVELEK